MFSEISSTGTLSDPTPATAEGGQRHWADILDRFAEQLATIDARDRGRPELTADAVSTPEEGIGRGRHVAAGVVRDVAGRGSD